MRAGTAVADDETAETGEAPTTAELAARVDSLDSKLDRIIDLFGAKKDQAHDAAQQHTEERLDRPTSVAEEIRAQLAAQRASDEAAAAGRADADWRKDVNDKLAGLTEQQPEPPQRRVEKLMGWR
jgi:hypothetical protein